MLSLVKRRQTALSVKKTSLTMVVALSAVMAGSVTSANAQLTNLNGNEGRLSILECVGLLVSDPAEHRAVCGVGENYQDRAPKTYSGASIGPVPTTPAAPAPVVEEVEEVEECKPPRKPRPPKPPRNQGEQTGPLVNILSIVSEELDRRPPPPRSECKPPRKGPPPPPQNSN